MEAGGPPGGNAEEGENAVRAGQLLLLALADAVFFGCGLVFFRTQIFRDYEVWPPATLAPGPRFPPGARPGRRRFVRKPCIRPCLRWPRTVPRRRALRRAAPPRCSACSAHAPLPHL